MREAAAKRSWWSAEKETNLRLWWQMGLSARAIADKLETTRNAVLGKAFRLGLDYHPDLFRPQGFMRTPKNRLL